MRVRNQLHLSADDMGVDGVFRDSRGGYGTYQVKFRTGRPALRWADLATFMGLSDAVDQRVLLTNCDSLPRAMNERTGFFCVRGTDLDRLDERDFDAIARYARGTPVLRRLKSPRPHQVEAVDAIHAGLIGADRATAIMACGSGKTLVALWAAERLGCRRVLVLVPSLALVRQTLHEWLRETRWEQVSYLCVCSDPTVKGDQDDLIVEQADLDFPVTTDRADVRAFLGRPYSGVRVVFSTYQSAPVVAAGASDGEPFHLGIFDEAHRTTGRSGRRFSFALRDENIAIEKRLFLTATPRHYDVLQRDEEGDARVVYSMDVPEDYGAVAYTLSFSEAVRRKIICDYRVVISVVTSEMLDRELLRRAEVVVDDNTVVAERVAHQVALRDAVAEFGMCRGFTFHGRVSGAKSFVADGGGGVRRYLPDFAVFHVNGRMRTSDREQALREFEEVERGLISNARCLMEGVDLPAVDLVAFMSPRRSKVDIVQAAGRAMRKDPRNPEKTTGYVMLPLLVEIGKGESIEQALARTRFDDVWTVLQTLKEQDAELAEVIRQMREDLGRTGKLAEGPLRDKISILGPELTLRQIESGISAACVEHLSTTWDERFGELLAYRKVYGDCNVPSSWPLNSALPNWVQTQRRAYRTGTLREDRRRRLDEIGFADARNANDAAWEVLLAALGAFKKTHGHCHVPHPYPQDPVLGTWANKLRVSQMNGTLRDDFRRRLDDIGFSWIAFDSSDATWEEVLGALVAYQVAQGHCYVPHPCPEDPLLGTWANELRMCQLKGALRSDRRRQLDEIGFVWDAADALDAADAAWVDILAALVAYKEAQGHCYVPHPCPEDPLLGTWANKLRTSQRQGELRDDQRRQLDKIGFVWDASDSLDAAWERMFATLLAYKEAYGDCVDPNSWSGNAALREWVGAQRRAYSEGVLRDDLYSRLEKTGFDWRSSESTREKVLPGLSDWLDTRRRAYNDRPLKEDSRLRVDEAGAADCSRDAAWEEMFAALAAYKEAHGDCNVPSVWPESPPLGTWVHKQREAYRTGALRDERCRRLAEIGFVWNTHDIAWEGMFAELVAYREAHGNCNVPSVWPENPALRVWVSQQIRAWRRGALSKERRGRLSRIGFSWKMWRRRW